MFATYFLIMPYDCLSAFGAVHTWCIHVFYYFNILSY